MKHVTAAILLHDGRILIARRPAHDNLSGKWEFPGGAIEDRVMPASVLQSNIEWA